MLSRIIEINENLSLQIKQNLDYKYAGEIWDAALVLTYFFINKKSEKIINIKNKIIIELGAGTGINGLILGALGAKKIILTDKGDCLDLLKENYENNKMKFDTNLICDIKELDWTKEDSRSSQEMKDMNNRPPVKNKVKNMDQYSTIFVGFPIWWGKEPTIVNTFLESYDLTDKIIIPFATYHSSGIGETDEYIKPSCKGAKCLIAKGFEMDDLDHIDDLIG